MRRFRLGSQHAPPPARPCRHRTYLLQPVLQALDVLSLAYASQARHQMWPVSRSVGLSVGESISRSAGQPVSLSRSVRSQAGSHASTHSLGEGLTLTRRRPPSAASESALKGGRRSGRGGGSGAAAARLAMVVRGKGRTVTVTTHAHTHAHTHACALHLVRPTSQPARGNAPTDGRTMRAWAGGRDGGQEGADGRGHDEEEQGQGDEGRSAHWVQVPRLLGRRGRSMDRTHMHCAVGASLLRSRAYFAWSLVPRLCIATCC